MAKFEDRYKFKAVFEDFVKKTKIEIDNLNREAPFPSDKEIEESIAHAKGDFMWRTLPASDDVNRRKRMEVYNGVKFKNFVNDIKQYFAAPEPPKSQEEFDEWHRKACMHVLAVLRRLVDKDDSNNAVGKDKPNNAVGKDDSNDAEDKDDSNDAVKVIDVLDDESDGGEGCYDPDDKESKVRYGKAQKIVNMTFKYLYCFANGRCDDTPEKRTVYEPGCRGVREEYFRFCHMPFDSFIKSWVEKEMRGKKFRLDAGDGVKTFSFDGGNVPSWSNMDYAVDFKNGLPYGEKKKRGHNDTDEDGNTVYAFDKHRYYSYEMIVEIIEDLIEKRLPYSKGGRVTICGDDIELGEEGEKLAAQNFDLKGRLTPLQAEFIIWPKITLQLAAEDFLKALNRENEDENVGVDKSLKTNIAAIYGKLNVFFND